MKAGQFKKKIVSDDFLYKEFIKQYKVKNFEVEKYFLLVNITEGVTELKLSLDLYDIHINIL
jgi:hypothetical protein